jgi:hypothetical protein
MNEKYQGWLCMCVFGPAVRSYRIPIISTVLVLVSFLGEIKSPVHTEISNITSCEFVIERCSKIYPPRIFKGIVATDPCDQIRITIYWRDPPLICEKTDNLAYSDMILQKNTISFWIHEEIDGRHFIQFYLNGTDEQFLLPRQNDLMSILQSIFDALREINIESSNLNEQWEMSRFFKDCRNRSESEYITTSKECKTDGNKHSTVSKDSAIMNALPFGRLYRKKILPDNSYIWQMSKVSSNRDLVTLTIKPISNLGQDYVSNTFDLDTLGNWLAVPEPYRRYWTFLRRYTELKDKLDSPSEVKKLYSEVDSYLSNQLPEDICSAFGKLRFNIALMTTSTDAISHSTCEYFSTLCERGDAPIIETIIELGRVAARIRKQWSDKQVNDLICPLLKKIARPSVFNNASLLKNMISEIKRQGWYWYARLLINIIQEQKCIDAKLLDVYSKDLEIWWLSKEVTSIDPNMLNSSVRDLMRRLGCPPLEGQLTIEDLRQILNERLEPGFYEQPDEKKNQFVENVLTSIRMISGDGPFNGDKARLNNSLVEFEQMQRSAHISLDCMHDLLTTFVALSFYDTSTKSDHEELISQLDQINETLFRETNQILGRYELLSLISRQDVEKIFARPYEDILYYVNDPLWPMFKYPLTENERTRVINKVRIRLRNVASQIPYEVVHIRLPQYPGVSCRQSVDVGLYVSINGHLYDNPDQAQEIFEKMKYFYLGHRLEEIVKRERELARISKDGLVVGEESQSE